MHFYTKFFFCKMYIWEVYSLSFMQRDSVYFWDSVRAHIHFYTKGVHNQYLGRCGHTTYRYLQCFSTVDAEKIFFRKILNFFQFYFRKEEEKQEAVKQSPVPVQNKK